MKYTRMQSYYHKKAYIAVAPTATVARGEDRNARLRNLILQCLSIAYMHGSSIRRAGRGVGLTA